MRVLSALRDTEIGDFAYSGHLDEDVVGFQILCDVWVNTCIKKCPYYVNVLGEGYP